jgi:hypothetical protein
MGLALSLGLAGTDSSLLKSVDWHCGHRGTVSERTRVSNVWVQRVQAYS